MPIKILVADDHALIRQGIRALLSADNNLRIVAEASDGMEAVSLAKQFLPDVAIVDVSMKGLNGIDAISQIVRHSPLTSVVVLSMFNDERYVNRSLTSGAKAYVLKDSSDEDLRQAIYRVKEGRTFFSPAIATAILEAYARNQGTAAAVGDKHELLTDREREVYQMLAEGKTNKIIAAELGLSIHTVETHRIRIMGKLGLHNMAELVLSAVRRGIVA